MVEYNYILEAGNVIYQGAEDNVGDTIRPRLEAAGADCSRVAFIDDTDKALTFTDDRLERKRYFFYRFFRYR